MNKSLCRSTSVSGLPRARRGTFTFTVMQVVMSLFLLMGLVKDSWADDNPRPEVPLTQVSLEELGQIEVTTVSKQPVKVSQTPAAIYVINAGRYKAQLKPV